MLFFYILHHYTCETSEVGKEFVNPFQVNYKVFTEVVIVLSKLLGCSQGEEIIALLAGC
jgi:hypothetical protein